MGNGSRGCYRRNHLAKPDLPGGINRKAGLCALRLLPPVTACARSWLLPTARTRRWIGLPRAVNGSLVPPCGRTDRPTDGLAGPVTGDGDWTGLAGFVATQRNAIDRPTAAHKAPYVAPVSGRWSPAASDAAGRGHLVASAPGPDTTAPWYQEQRRRVVEKASGYFFRVRARHGVGGWLVAVRSCCLLGVHATVCPSRWQRQLGLGAPRPPACSSARIGLGDGGC